MNVRYRELGSGEVHVGGGLFGKFELLCLDIDPTAYRVKASRSRALRDSVNLISVGGLLQFFEIK